MGIDIDKIGALIKNYQIFYNVYYFGYLYIGHDTNGALKYFVWQKCKLP